MIACQIGICTSKLELLILMYVYNNYIQLVIFYRVPRPSCPLDQIKTKCSLNAPMLELQLCKCWIFSKLLTQRAFLPTSSQWSGLNVQIIIH